MIFYHNQTHHTTLWGVNMIDYLAMVAEFHYKFEHYTAIKTQIPPINVVVLRRRLISEEAMEFDHAASQGDLVEIADALADLLYVVFGSALAFGIPIDKVFAEVHRSNMTKQGKDEFGKTIKGPDYTPPEIKGILGK